MREEIVLDDFDYSDYYLTDVEDVKYEKFDQTYNIEVDDVHLYFANNFYVKNSGRQPALLLSLAVNHPDIEEFITSKTKKGQIEKANISVQVTDDFMEALREGRNWKLTFSTNRETIEKEVDPEYLIKLISETANNSAEPGVQYINQMQRGSMIHAVYETTGYTKYKIISTNACQSGFARVLTPGGIRYLDDVGVGDVIWSGKEWTTIIDKWCNGIKPVYKYETTSGVFVGTSDHKVLENGNRKEVVDANKIDQSIGPDLENINIIPESVMDGLIIGDGTAKGEKRGICLCIGKDDYDYFSSEISDLIVRSVKKNSKCGWEVVTSINYEELPKTYNRIIPERYISADKNHICSFLRGIFSANGGVCSYRVCLKQTSYTLIRQVQDMLSSVGIPSYITYNKPKRIKFDNGEYQIKKSYDLNIYAGLDKFRNKIGFIQKYKQKRIDEIVEERLKGNPRKTYPINNVEYLGDYPVYEITVDAPEHTYWTSGCLVSNCSEKPLPAYGICNLGSINMEMFSTDENEYKKQLDEIVPYLVRFQDDVVSYELENEKSPIPQQKDILEKTREIGLGITNLHGWLLKQNLQYDSDEAIEKVNNFYKYYAYCVFKSSMELGKERGNAPAFDLVTPKDLYENSIYFRNIVDEFFGGDYNQVTHMRNMAHMSVAPTGSLSNSFPTPCLSSGVEPVIAPYYWRKTRAMSKGDYDYYFVIPDRVKENILSQMDPNTEDYKKVNEFSGSALDNDGQIGLELVEIIRKYISSEFLKPAHEIDYNKKIEMMGKLYQFTDAALSATFNLPSSSTTEDVKNIYLKAYDEGVRAVSVYREGSREGILIFEDPITHKAKYQKKDQLCLDRPEDISFHCAPKRPKELKCNIHHTTVKGEKWLVLIGLFNGKPYEMFAGTQEDLYLPKSVEEGIIDKNGKGKYNLRVQIRSREVEHKDIANVLMDDKQRALTRMLSTCLRHGVPVEFITDQLKKSKADITDFSSAVSRVLSKYATYNLSSDKTCPECGEAMTPMEGCVKCTVCSYSECE